ncbi:unnamed protein product, partial [Mesorhabditis belari]|uniref:RING-type E3 ubiquitin transferase n=1 Tax=Mesorhabditis belari TaxID=2138241 RepID=A0AAF3E8E2_9BILA
MATSAQPNKANHEGVSCDGCMAPNFAGNRYKCLRCYDFDLCHTCYISKRYNPPIPSDGQSTQHTDAHPVLCILTQRDFELLYMDDQSKNYLQCKIAVITCPYCGQTGFSHTTFFEHLQREHHEPPQNLNVNCPLCIACPDYDANREVENLYNHWTNTHTTFEPTGTMQRDNSRALRRPTLGVRRIPRQPAERRGHPTQRTLQRLYAEVLADNGVPGAGVGTAVQQLYNGLGALPWTSELVDVDDMFRMATLNRNLPNLPTDFNATPTEGLRITQITQIPTNATTSGLIPTFRSTVNARAHASTNNEYAAPSSSRQPNNTRGSAITSVQVIRSLGSTSIYPSVQENLGEERNVIQNLVFDVEDEEDSSFDEANDEQEFESAEESAVDEMGIDTAYSDLRPTAGVPINEAPRIIAATDKLISPEYPINEDEKRSRNLGGEFIWDSETEESETEHDELMSSLDGGKQSSINQDPQSSTSFSDEKFDGINPLQELRKVCSDSEWATVMHAAFEEEHSESEDRLDTPKAHLARSQSSEFRDPQCWLTVQIDTSQLQFTATPQHWRDTRFLKQKKMNRELSVVSDIERVIEQDEIAESIIRSALPTLLSGRELNSTSISIRNALSNVDVWKLSQNSKTDTVKLKNPEDNVETMHQLLQSEALALGSSHGLVSSSSTEIAQPSQTEKISDDSAGRSDEDPIHF